MKFIDSQNRVIESADLVFLFGLFSDTEVEVKAISANGREFFAGFFGAGAVSVKVPKSKAVDLAEFAQRKGLTI
jgi:hypothetical protein